MTRLSAEQLMLLRRLDEGWRPLWLLVGKAGRALERKGMVRVDYGPDDSPDQNKLWLLSYGSWSRCNYHHPRVWIIRIFSLMQGCAPKARAIDYPKRGPGLTAPWRRPPVYLCRRRRWPSPICLARRERAAA